MSETTPEQALAVAASRFFSDLEAALDGWRSEMQAVADQVRADRERGSEMLTVYDVAKILKITPAAVYSRVRRRGNPLPAFRDGVVRVRRSDLEEWIERECQQPKTGQ